MQEIELHLMKISYTDMVTEDGEAPVTSTPTEPVQSSFDTPVKNYRIVEGSGVTFHCKMGGLPLPKVPGSSPHRRWFPRNNVLQVEAVQQTSGTSSHLTAQTIRILQH